MLPQVGEFPVVIYPSKTSTHPKVCPLLINLILPLEGFLDSYSQDRVS